MTSLTEGNERPGSPQGQEGQAGTPSPEPATPPAPSGFLPFLAAAGTLFAAMQLWPSAGSRPTWASWLFLVAVFAVAYFVGRTVATVYGSCDVAARARSSVLLVLVVLLPTFVDLRTVVKYNMPKLIVMLIGVLAISAVWAVEMVRPERRPLWRNGLHWPVAALAGWTAVTTATSVSPRMSVLGAIGTSDGLLAATAFAVIFFAAAQVVTLEHVKAVLAVLYFGGGGLTVLYGLIQLHDRLFSGRTWDWLHDFGGKEVRDFAFGDIFSSFGNPNDLGGFLAILAPIGLGLLVLYRSRRIRILTLAITFVLVVELLQSGSRGALLATLVALGLAGALLWPERPPRLNASVLAGAAVASVVVALIAFAAVPTWNAKLRSTLSGSTLSIRADYWRIGLAMANDRPLVGYGPDTWTARAMKYRGAEVVERHGADSFGNSAHNLFIGQAAATGYPGLALLVVLLGFAALRAIGTWRRLRQREASGEDDEASRARTARLLLVGIVGGLVAYLVQASFNVSRIGLGFAFWVLLGLLCALSLAAGVPVSLRAGALVRRPGAPAALLVDVQTHDDDAEGPPREPKANGEPRPATAAVGILACVGLVVGVSVVTRPLRADHNAWAAQVDMGVAARATAGRANEFSQSAAIRRNKAIELNPWEPTYLLEVAERFLAQALSYPDRSPPQLTTLRRTLGFYQRAILLRPHTATYLERYASVLHKIYDADAADLEARAGAIQALRRAIEADPAGSARARQRLQLLLAS